MASYSQIRLHQLTGSAVDLKNKLADYKGQATAAALTGSDALDLLGALAASVQKIHGRQNDEVFDAKGGEFYQSLLITGSNSLSFYDTGTNISSPADGKITVASDGDLAEAIYLHANGGTSESIVIRSDQGTGEGSIQLLSDAGGVDIDAAAAKDVNIAGGQVALVSKDNAASAISLTANQGSSETIVVTNTQGTADGAISLVATVGGVLVDVDDASKKVHLDSEGSVDIDAVAGLTLDVATGGVSARDLAITVSGGGDSSLLLSSDGTGTDAIDIDATAGDIQVGRQLLDGKTLKLGNPASIQAVFAPSATAGDEKFILTNVSGDDPEAVKLFAAAGGLVLSGAADKVAKTRAGQVQVESTRDIASAIKLHTNVGSSETIFIHNQAGTDLNKAIEILAEAGSIDIFTQASQRNVQVRAEQGGVQLSGSLGIGLSGSVAFSADGLMRENAAQQTGTMAFANFPGEFSRFRSKDLFTRETSVIGALNALADAAAGGILTKKVVTASISANTDLVLNAATLDGGGVSGFADAIVGTNIGVSNTEVYVNGQLLLSGTSAPGASVAGGDYTFQFGNPAQLRFVFDLEADDVLLLKTTAAQSSS